MKIERFKELLNLYLDDEISSAELTELISDVERDLERQELFIEYCRIHKACSRMRNELNGKRVSHRAVGQFIYAFVGLAAAFALLAMAGRNLVPLIGGGEETVAVQSTEKATKRFPEFAATEVLAVSGKRAANRVVLQPLGSSIGSRIDINQVRFAENRLRLRIHQGDFLGSIGIFSRDGMGRVLRPGFGESIDKSQVFDVPPVSEFPPNLTAVSRIEFEAGVYSLLFKD